MLNRNRTNPQGIPKIAGSVCHWELLTPGAYDFDHGPCDAVAFDEIATVTGTDAEGAAGTSPPLAPNVWHPMSLSAVTGTSAASGLVWVGWVAR